MSKDEDRPLVVGDHAMRRHGVHGSTDLDGWPIIGRVLAVKERNGSRMITVRFGDRQETEVADAFTLVSEHHAATYRRGQ